MIRPKRVLKIVEWEKNCILIYWKKKLCSWDSRLKMDSHKLNKTEIRFNQFLTNINFSKHLSIIDMIIYLNFKLFKTKEII